MDQTHTIMPGSISGTHLVECPQCHASNGVTAVRCWNCDRTLPPELPAVTPADLASESAWPKNAFEGVDLSGAAPAGDGSTAAADTAAFDADGTGTRGHSGASLDLPQTSRSERRARLAASSAADASMTLPSDLFAAGSLPLGPIGAGEASTQPGPASADDTGRAPTQSSTLDEQARAAIPDWKPEPWKPSLVPSGKAAEPVGTERPESPASTTEVPPEPGLRAGKPVEFFPQFQAVRPSNTPTPGAAAVTGAEPAPDTVGSVGASQNEPVARSSAATSPFEAKAASTSPSSPASGSASNAEPMPSPATSSSPPASKPLAANTAEAPRPPYGGRPTPPPRSDQAQGPDGRPRRMTPEEIAATFRAPIRRHPWQDPRWLGAGAALLALVVGLGVFFYPSSVDESDWTPASTRGLVEQRGAARDPQAILDGQPVGGPVVRPARDPQAILNGEPTSAGAGVAAALEADAPRTPVANTPSSRAAASAAIDALLATPASTAGTRTAPVAAPAVNRQPAANDPSMPSATSGTSDDAPAVTSAAPNSTPATATAAAPASSRTTAVRPPLADAASPSGTECAPNVMALGLCPAR